MSDQIIILGLLILMVGLFIWGRWRYDAISLGILSVFVLLGYIEPNKAFSGFAHPAVITVALVLLISKGLERSGFISVIGRQLQNYANTEFQFMISITFFAALLSSFMNNIGAMAMLLPITLGICQKMNWNPSKFLIPLSFASILGGMNTKIGTPPNIKISQDSLFGIDDGMAFTQMWRWSIEKYGPLYLANENDENNSLLQISNDMISITPMRGVKYGQLTLEYGYNINSINVIDNIQLNGNGIILNDINDAEGVAIIEFAHFGDLNLPIGFNFKAGTAEDLDVRVTYALFDGNYNLLDEKDSIVNRVYVPEKFSLMQNYPNPFNPKTTIRFSLPVDSNVELIIYDVNGKVVKEIINHNMETGSYKVVWDGTNKGGALVGSGVYFYRIKAGNFIASQKMIFLK